MITALINTDLNGSGGHWILGLADVPKRRIILMDSSMIASNTFYRKFFFLMLHVLHVAYEISGIWIDDKSWQDWELVLSLNAVQQTNSIDCGPIAVANFYAAIQKLMLTTTPNSHQLRRWLHLIASSKDKTVPAPDNLIEETMMHDGEVTSSIDDHTHQKRLFRPQGLQFSYQDAQQYVSELELHHK